MRKIVLLATALALLTAAHLAAVQTYVGLRGALGNAGYFGGTYGLSVFTFIDSMLAMGDEEDARFGALDRRSSRTAGQVGLFALVELSDNFGLGGEVTYTRTGSAAAGGIPYAYDGYYVRSVSRLNYLSVPVTARLMWDRRRGRSSVFLGPELYINLGSNSGSYLFYDDRSDEEGESFWMPPGWQRDTYELSDGSRSRVYLAGVVGGSREFPGDGGLFFLDSRASIGITRAVRSDTARLNLFNLYFGMGFATKL